MVAPADFLSGLEGTEGVTLRAAAVVACSVWGERLLVLIRFEPQVVLSGGLKDSATAEGRSHRSHLWGFPDGRRGAMWNFPLSFDHNLAFALQWTRIRKATG